MATPRASRNRAAAARTRPDDFPWADLPDEELLQWRMCDLGLKIEGTLLEERIDRLHEELAYRLLDFRPHYYLADEWFSPDDAPGIAIPFYLAHPRLTRLERKQMLEVEGGPEDWCLKILRHEAGHVFDTAYQLHRRREYRELFGRYSAPYPERYKARPYSKSYVLHLEPWYAQAHPAEDFAETFAVWLRPRSRWRAHYENWPAIKKLQYVERLMNEIRGARPKVQSRAEVDGIKDLTKTLAEHYQQKRDRYGLDHPKFFDRDLRRLFSDSPDDADRPSAAAFLRRIRSEIREAVAEWTGEYQYTIDQVLREMIDRCRELKLRVDRPVRQAKRDALVMLTVQTMNYLHAGHHLLVL